jgi:hypothetical protein
MGSLMVVAVAPVLDHAPDFVQTGEDVAIQVSFSEDNCTECQESAALAALTD